MHVSDIVVDNRPQSVIDGHVSQYWMHDATGMDVNTTLCTGGASAQHGNGRAGHPSAGVGMGRLREHSQLHAGHSVQSHAGPRSQHMVPCRPQVAAYSPMQGTGRSMYSHAGPRSRDRVW